LNDFALMTMASVVNGSGQPVRVERVLVARDNAFVGRVLREAPNPFHVKLVRPERGALFEVIAAQVTGGCSSDTADIEKLADTEKTVNLDAETAVTPRL
jgi:hypothetical protein